MPTLGTSEVPGWEGQSLFLEQIHTMEGVGDASLSSLLRNLPSWQFLFALFFCISKFI